MDKKKIFACMKDGSMMKFFRARMAKGYGIVAAMFFIAATCSFSACQKDGSEPVEEVKPDPNFATSRTVMVYMVAENSLNPRVSADFEEMRRGMRDQTLQEGDRLVVYVDDVSLPRIYVMTKDTTATQLIETYAEDVNSASAEQLKKFVAYTKEKYPADSYGLVLWSHATGWLPSSYSGDQQIQEASQRRSFGLDNQRNSASNYLNGHQMRINDMAEVLEACGGVDFMFFDACFMQSAEVAYTLRHATNHVITSPAEIPGPGADYMTMVSAMFRKSDYVEKMLDAYYQTYAGNSSYGIVISSIETEALTEFATYMQTVVDAHRQELLSVDFSTLLSYCRFSTWTTAYPDYPDMQSVMKQVLTDSEYAGWQTKAAQVVKCLHTDTWYTALASRNIAIPEGECSGLSMFVPRQIYNNYSSDFNTLFLNTEWAQEVWKGKTGLEDRKEEG